MPFHIIAGMVKHVELQNLTRVSMDQSQKHEPRIIVHNRLRGMELGSQLGP
jgi:hypothetical protein